MKDKVQIIREALLRTPEHSLQTKALAALDQIEKMAGAPVAWIRGSGIEMLKLENGGCATVYASEGMSNHSSPLYAAPVAQQYEAGDVASAAAQGFRDGVASVTQQEPVAWAMPKGDGTFIDVITPAEHARDEGSYTVPLFAHPVAQQPQAKPHKPLFADLIAQHPGLREELLEMDKRPQAEPFGYVSQHTNGTWEFSPTPAGVYPDTAKSITAVYTKQPQAEAVHRYVLELPDDDKRQAKVFWSERNEANGEITHHLCISVDATPQQAEAVPSDVVRDAERYRFIRDADRSACIDRELSLYAMDSLDEFVDAAMADEATLKADAAMAQGEKP